MTAQRAQTIYRADHCGSLVRPQRLRTARLDFRRGRISAQELARLEDECILAALALQREAGLQIFSDGEFRRDFWLSAVSDEYFDGMENQGIDYVRHPYLKGKDIKDSDYYVPPNPVVKGKLARKKRITASEIAFLKARAPGPFKATIPSPVTLSRSCFRPGVSDRVYPTFQDLFNDYARLVAEEITDMVADGVTYLQLDAPHYTRFIIPNRQKQLTDIGVDIKTELAMAIEAENRCLRAAKRPGVTTAVHICLGTFILGPQGPLGGAGEYDDSLVGHLIGALDADVFLIEYSERTGSLEALRQVPRNKVISLGIINTRDPRVETPDEIKYRVDAVAKYVPLENLSICPNCGFSGAAVETWVTEDIEKRKLAVLVETAAQIWH
jgi:5-methyltetrahydropteroyltriglutamate--homocysteine methyltransferase